MLVVVVVVCAAGAVVTTGAGVGLWTVVELNEQAATERQASTMSATSRI
ncbi:hypothetical protein [Enhydrobacter sp.]|jgi:hypothetical protein|nr:hypothetical protein [Enhydrobacter sp.]WIM10926.1 MAG: hypothetical protein OJF58_001883 [Enhydrobacter sp.]